MQLGRDADYLRANVKKTWICKSTPPLSHHDEVLN